MRSRAVSLSPRTQLLAALRHACWQRLRNLLLNTPCELFSASVQCRTKRRTCFSCCSRCGCAKSDRFRNCLRRDGQRKSTQNQRQNYGKENSSFHSQYSHTVRGSLAHNSASLKVS